MGEGVENVWYNFGQVFVNLLVPELGRPINKLQLCKLNDTTLDIPGHTALHLGWYPYTMYVAYSTISPRAARPLSGGSGDPNICVW